MHSLTGLYFPVFELDTRKYAQEKNSYLDTFTLWDLTTNVADFKLLSKQLPRHEKIMYVSDHFVPL